MKDTKSGLGIAIAAFMAGVLISEAMGQATTSTTINQKAESLEEIPQAQMSTTFRSRPQQFDIESRVAILERQVARLRSEVDHLIAQNVNSGVGLTESGRRLTTPSQQEDTEMPTLRNPPVKIPIRPGD